MLSRVVSQSPANQPPPQAGNADKAGSEGAAPAGGSWPPVPPPLVNRLVSSATATPFVPEEKRPAVFEIPFSCVVEPPEKRARLRVPDEKAAASARSVVPTAPAAPATAGKPAVVPNPLIASGRASPAAQTPTNAHASATPMTTVPPFAVGGTSAPFASTSETPFEFNPEKPPRVRWLSWSTGILLAGCVAGYFQYQRMQQANAAAPAVPMASTVATPAEGTAASAQAASSSIATPFTALKQAKATIKDAGEKHKAAYDLVEKMLDDPNAAVDTAPKPVAPASVVQAPAPDSIATPKRDAVAALLGTDGELLVPVNSPKPTLRFARWVRAVKIGGARLNDNPRVLVGAAAFTFGDVVETNLGIVLDGYNAERRALRFRETATGAVIERRI